MPTWWRWYYWGSPTSWTIYGVLASQLGDVTSKLEIPGSDSMAVNEFLEKSFGFKHDFVVPVALVHLGWVLLFFFIFTGSIRFLNFQRR